MAGQAGQFTEGWPGASRNWNWWVSTSKGQRELMGNESTGLKFILGQPLTHKQEEPHACLLAACWKTLWCVVLDPISLSGAGDWNCDALISHGTLEVQVHISWAAAAHVSWAAALTVRFNWKARVGNATRWSRVSLGAVLVRWTIRNPWPPCIEAKCSGKFHTLTSCEHYSGASHGSPNASMAVIWWLTSSPSCVWIDTGVHPRVPQGGFQMHSCTEADAWPI